MVIGEKRYVILGQEGLNAVRGEGEGGGDPQKDREAREPVLQNLNDNHEGEDPRGKEFINRL